MVWSRGSFSWFGTFIFGFLVQFWYRYQFSVQSNDIEILGGGAWVWSLPVIFGSRDLDFRFPRSFLHTGTNFRSDWRTFDFLWGRGWGVWVLVALQPSPRNDVIDVDLELWVLSLATDTILIIDMVFCLALCTPHVPHFGVHEEFVPQVPHFGVHFVNFMILRPNFPFARSYISGWSFLDSSQRIYRYKTVELPLSPFPSTYL